MEVRPAAPSDALGIATVHVHTWQSAYRGIVPGTYLESLSVQKRESIWREALCKRTPELWVYDVEGAVAGWISFGPSRDTGADASTGELEALYVTPAYWDMGVGRALWLTARHRLIERGFSAVTLWVLEDNSRAIRFYRAAGFVPDLASAKQIDIGGKPLMEIRYGASLDRH